eukprot:3508102-Ditylum_brightwellii.AAC.1
MNKCERECHANKKYKGLFVIKYKAAGVTLPTWQVVQAVPAESHPEFRDLKPDGSLGRFKKFRPDK